MPAPDFAETAADGRALVQESLAIGWPMLRNLQRDNEPSLVLFETQDAASGGIMYSRNAVSTRSMQRFVRGLQVFLSTLLSQPESRSWDIGLER